MTDRGPSGLTSTPLAPSAGGGLVSQPIGGPSTIVPLSGNNETVFVKSPVTGDVRAVPQNEAAELVLRAGWEPVVEPAAERLLSNQLLRERSSPFTAAGLGAFSGLTGGLGEFVLPQGSESGARALAAAREEHPVAGLTGELAGTAAPFLGPLKGMKLLSLPGLAEAAGTGATELAGGGALARAAGMGLEAGIQGATYTAGQTSIDDTPLTAQKLAAGFLLGATPGAVLGLGAGVGSDLLSRFGVRGKVVRENILKPGMSDLDIMQIAQREHGVAVPGLSDEILSGVANNPHVTPEVAALAKDAGPVGQQIRREMLDADQLRGAAYKRAADALNQIRDLDEAAINGVAGRMKAEQVRNWIPGGEENDPGMAIMEAWRDDTPEEIGVRQRQMESTNNLTPRGKTESEFSIHTIAPSKENNEIADYRRRYDELTGRIEKQNLRDEAQEKFGVDISKAEATPVSAPSRGAVATIEYAPGKGPVGEPAPPPTARAERIGKIGKAIEVWAHDNTAVDSELRRSLGAGFGRKNLRDAIRRGLIGKDPELMSAVQRAYANASQESRAQLDELLGKHFDIKAAPSVQPWRSNALEMLDGMGQHANALAGQSRGVVGKKAADANRIRDIIADAYGKVHNGDKAAAFIELDYLKKRLARYAAPGEYLSVDQNVAALARQQYEEVRQLLERPELWGQKAANAQKDINRIFTNRINRADVFFDKFYTDSGRVHPANPWIRQREATPETVARQLNGIIDPKDSREFQAFKQHIQESRDVLANLKNHYVLSSDESNALGRWNKAIGDADNAFDLAAYYSRREAQAQALMKQHAGPVPSWAKWVAMHFLGPAGFLGVGAAEKLLNPGKGMYMRAVLERTMRTSESRIASAVTKLITGKSPKLTGLGLSQMAARGTVSIFGDKPADRQNTYVETIKHLTEIADPNQASQQVRKALPFAVAFLPKIEQNLGATLSSAAQYILSKAPNQPRWTPQGIVTDPVSDTELEEFEATIQGALDPVSVFEQAAEGKPVHPEAVFAASDVNPELMDHVRMLAISELAQSKKQIPYSNLINVSLVLDMDLDPTMDSGYINAQQMLYASRKAAAPPPSSDRTTGNPDGVNKSYRSLHMSKDDQIELGEPPS